MFILTEHSLKTKDLEKELTSSSAGAFVSFAGRVRDHHHGRGVKFLEYEAAGSLCRKEAHKIIVEAKKNYGVIKIVCAHRTGRLKIGETAVWIGVVSGHRDEAFKACRYVIDEVKKRLPIWKKEFFTDGTSHWVDCACTANETTKVDFLEKDFYSRQSSLPQIGDSGQKKLKQSKVLVVGAGGLGSPVLMSLASVGVGTVGIAEFDNLETHNLHRQNLYSFSDVGKPKIDLAVERVRGINPFIKIKPHRLKVGPKNVLKLIAGYSLVINCTDNFASKFLLNDACFLQGKILVQASVYQWEGQLRVLYPPARGCLRCFWHEQLLEGCVGNCAQAGVVGAVANVLGHLQALEVIKVLLQLPERLKNETMIFDAMSLTSRRIKETPQASCPLCGQRRTIKKINPNGYDPEKLLTVDANEICLHTGNKHVLVDIREEDERRASPVKNIRSLHLPLSRFDPEALRLDRDKSYVLFCMKGHRSLLLTEKLRQMGFPNVLSLKGGADTLKGLLN